MAAVPDFEDLIKQINPSATAVDVAAKAIALRLMRAALGGNTALDAGATAAFDINLRALVTSVRTIMLDPNL